MISRSSPGGQGEGLDSDEVRVFRAEGTACAKVKKTRGHFTCFPPAATSWGRCFMPGPSLAIYRLLQKESVNGHSQAPAG